MEKFEQKIENKSNNKIIKVIIGLLIFGVLSGIIYAIVTGNLIWQLFKKDNIVDKNMQNAQVISDKILESDIATIKLNKIACNSSFIIIEYNLNIKDKGLEELKSEKIENEFVLRNAFLLNEETLNNPYTLEKDNKENYKQYYKKISDNEYIVYDIIDIINENTNEFILKITPAALVGRTPDSSEIGYVDLELDNYFLINIKLVENNENNIKVEISNVISI